MKVAIKSVKAKVTAGPKATGKSAIKPAKAVKAASSKKSPGALLCERISKILDTNKAEQILTLTLIGQCSFADYMIVASGRAPRHVAALADYVADMLKKEGNPPLSIEGKDTGDWVLIDAGDIIVHIFRPEIRQFYNIEKMWTLPPVADAR